eukprot:scaffold33378_cov97-Skeletonema_dohrnii-CCMP3373.AAC.1
MGRAYTEHSPDQTKSVFLQKIQTRENQSSCRISSNDKSEPWDVTIASDEWRWRDEATGLTDLSDWSVNGDCCLIHLPQFPIPCLIGLDKYVGWNMEGGCGKVILVTFLRQARPQCPAINMGSSLQGGRVQSIRRTSSY